MSMDLNLLPTVAKFQLEKIRFKKMVNEVVVISVALWVLVGSLVMAGWLLARWNLNNQADKNKKVQSELLTLAGNAAINQQLRHKAKLVGGILSQRFEYYSAFKGLDSLFSKNVTIQNYNLDKERRFIIDATAVGSQGVDEVEERVRAINAGEVDKFNSAKMVSLLKSSGQWSFKMEVGIK